MNISVLEWHFPFSVFLSFLFCRDVTFSFLRLLVFSFCHDVTHLFMSPIFLKGQKFGTNLVKRPTVWGEICSQRPSVHVMSPEWRNLCFLSWQHRFPLPSRSITRLRERSWFGWLRLGNNISVVTRRTTWLRLGRNGGHGSNKSTLSIGRTQEVIKCH